MSKGSFGKSLKGSGNISAKLLGPLEDSILGLLNAGIELTNVTITGGTIDGVVIGDGQPGPGHFTTLQTGSPSGQGYEVCFFGLIVGDSACWEPLTSTWNVQGNLTARDYANLGNLLISGNTISASNSNGNINITPNGTGRINLNAGINQNTVSGNVSFNTTSGAFSVFSGNPITLNTNNKIDLTTKQKDISIKAGTNPSRYAITNITSAGLGGIVTVTTSTTTPYIGGESIKIFNTSSGADAYYTVISTSGNTFQVQLPATVSIPAPIVTGTTSYSSSINLTPDDYVNIAVNKKLTFGGNQSIYGNSLGDLFLTPDTTRSIIIPDNNFLQLGSSSRTISSDGSGIIVDTPLYYTGAPITTITTPSNIQDRGIEFNYNIGGDKTGFFGYDTSKHIFTFLTNTTNNNGVISGTPGDFEVGNLTVNGTIINNGVSGANDTVERLILTGVSVNVSPSPSVNITLVSITDSSTVTGVLPAGTVDGFLKYVNITSLAIGAKYQLTCPTGRLLDPGSGTTTGKTLVFDTPGQGVHLMWDNALLAYLIVNAGASLI